MIQEAVWSSKMLPAQTSILTQLDFTIMQYFFDFIQS